MPARPIGEETDPAGRRVALDEDALAHIFARHPEMRIWVDDILVAVAAPDEIESDPIGQRVRYLKRSAGPTNWLRVVVDFEVLPGRVVTAFGIRRRG